MVPKKYPAPDIKFFCRAVGGMAASLTVLHWAPDVMVWIYANWMDKTIVINERRYHALLVIAYVMAAVPTLLWIVGACYATWQNRKLERQEQNRD